MIAVQCQSCGRVTGAKRALGFGTYFMVVITLGLWLFAIPFYPLRCVVCGEYHGRPGWRNFVVALAANLAVGAFSTAIREAVTHRHEPAPIINAYEQHDEMDTTSKQYRRPPKMTLTYSNGVTVTYSENDTVTLTPAQLISNSKSYLDRKIILNGAKLTDKLGKSGPCSATLLFSNRIAACIPGQSEATNTLLVGESVDMACVVNNLSTSDPTVVLRDCLIIPATGRNTGSEEAANTQDHQLHAVPKLFSAGAISDGRTYSVALISGDKIPPGTELFAQGIILGQVGAYSILLGDEQDREKRLVCSMSPEESGEATYLYHTGDRVQVYGVSSGPYDGQGSPLLALGASGKESPGRKKVVMKTSALAQSEAHTVTPRLLANSEMTSC